MNYKVALLLFVIWPCVFAETSISSCRPLNADNTAYKLNSDVSYPSTCFPVEAENVTLDCNGHSVTGINATGSFGIYSNRYNTNVINCHIAGFQHGIYFSDADHGTIRDSTANTTHEAGFSLLLHYHSDYNTVDNFRGNAVNYSILVFSYSNYNLIENSTGHSKERAGITVDNNNDNRVSRCIGTSEQNLGMSVEDARNVAIIDSTARSAGAHAIYVQDSDSVIIENVVGISDQSSAFNFYRMNNSVLSNFTANTQSHGVFLRFGENNTVDCGGNPLIGQNGSFGIYSSDDDTKILNCKVHDFKYGIYFDNAKNGLIENCQVSTTSNGGMAVCFENETSHSTISNCHLDAVSSWGLYVSSGIGNSVYGTNIYANGIRGGAYFSGTDGIIDGITSTSTSNYGLLLWDSDGSTISNSLFSTNSGVPLNLSGSSANNMIVNNTFIADGLSHDLVYVEAGSGGNTFYWNNFTDTFALYANDNSGTNSYDYSFSGRTEGNVWANVIDGTVEVTGTVGSIGYPGLEVGDSGSGYPYNNANSLGKVTMGVVDNAPLTSNNSSSAPIDIAIEVSECQELWVEGATYKATKDVFAFGSSCFPITARDITIDCQGHSIIGDNTTSSYAIFSAHDGTKIQNCRISNFHHGIFFNGVSHSLVENSEAHTTGHYGRGIYLLNSDYNSINNTNLSSFSGPAIHLYFGSDSNTLTKIISFSEKSQGMRIESSDYNVVDGSAISSDLGVATYLYNDADYNTISNTDSNSASSYGIFVYMNSDFNNITGSIASGKAGAYLNNAYGTFVKGCSFFSSSTYAAMLLAYVDHSVMLDSLFTGFGVEALKYNSNGCNHNLFINNTFASAANDLVFINPLSTNNTFYWNNFTHTSEMYVRDYNGKNHYSFDVGANEEGNIWANAIDGSVEITGTTVSAGFPTLFVGENGLGYPYNNVNSGGKVSSGVIDNAPLTMMEPLVCRELGTSNSVYALTADVHVSGRTCFIISASNVTIDCQGFSITGDNSSSTIGIYSSSDGTKIRNCQISNFHHGIYFNGVTNSLIENSEAHTTYFYGRAIYLVNSDYNNIVNTRASSFTGPSVHLYSGSDSNALANVVSYSVKSQGMRIESSDYNRVDGSSIFSQSGVGTYIYNGADFNSIKNLNSTSVTSYGIFVYNNSDFNNITNTTASGKAGAYLNDAHGTIIRKCEFSSRSGYAAMLLGYADYSLVRDSLLTGTGVEALEFYGSYPSSHNLFVKNTFISAENDLVRVNPQSYENTFYWNNFTPASGLYARDFGINNHYSADIDGRVEGNIWGNVVDGTVQVTGIESSMGYPWLNVGEAGTGYPYNNANSLGKVSAGVVDIAPLTNQITLMCGVLGIPNKIYSMTSDLLVSGDRCFKINAANVTLDCQGFSITGDNSSGTIGVYSAHDGTKIRNCVIGNFNHGIYLNGVDNSVIENSEVHTTYYYGRGIYLVGSDSNSILETIVSSFTGPSVHLYLGSDSNTLRHVSTSSVHSQALRIENSDYNAVEASNATSGSDVATYFYNDADHNTINNSGSTSASNYGVFVYQNSDFNSIVGMTASGRAGIYLNNAYGTNVSGSEFSSFSTYSAMLLAYSGHSAIEHNSFTGIGVGALDFYDSYPSVNNRFVNNTFASATEDLVTVNSQSNGNAFYWNTFTGTSGRFVNDKGSGNYYNTEAAGVPSGNYWANIDSLAIYDSNSDGWGDYGADYPYSESSSGGKLVGGVDYGPATKKACP